MWSVNDKAAGDLTETCWKPTGNLPQQVKETKSEVFPVLNNVGLEVQVIWIVCPKPHQISNVVGSLRVSGYSIINRPHGILNLTK